MRQELHAQADRIEYLLAQYGLYARVVGGTVSPQTIRFHLLPAQGTRLKRFTALTEELALLLGVSQCHISRQQGCLNLEIPRSNRVLVRLTALYERLGNVPPCTAVLGLDQEGNPLLLNLPSPDVSHVLITGTTGSGKTELTRAIIASLARFNRQSQLQIVLIDPKNRGFAPFYDLPHLLHPIVSEWGDVIVVLEGLVEEMMRRDRQGRNAPRLVVFIDELADLALTAPRQVHDPLSRLAQRGRQAGIHLIICTQKPTVGVLGCLAKANFPVRLVGTVTTPEEAKMATGMARSGAEKLLGRGDFIAVTRGETVRFQAAYIPGHEIESLAGAPGPAHERTDSRTMAGSEGWGSVPRVRPVRGLRRIK